MQRSVLDHKWAGYVVAVLSLFALTLVLKIVGTHVNAATVSLALLLNVLFIATRWGSLPALFTSILAMLCFNETGKIEIERLYAELRDAFERASHAEALRQSEKLKSALLDAVTHDLRTPLTSIKASITTLLDEAHGRVNGEPPVTLDAESKVEMMEIIDEESDRLSRFISGLIELARIEAGELQLRRRWGVVDEIISAALSRAEPMTKQHRVTLEVEKELPGVRVDERAVSEVVYTLIDNAAKYSSKGSTILISAQRAGDEQIQMAVEDEGRGIPIDFREQVFDKFFRATRDGDVSQQPTGTGMGLAIAKGIVEAHEGRIWIESGAGGKGTRVMFTLPIGDEDYST